MSFTFNDIERLFAEKGGRAYSGEPVTQLEHALQSAYLAEQAGAEATLIAAALLHDLGHLINDQGTAENSFTPTLQGVDDQHQRVALPPLRQLFGDAVLQPIRLHVDAKRYLCARGDDVVSGADYRAALSPDSLRSLELQGGVFDEAQADRFITQPYAAQAVQVRRWDDQAKIAGQRTPALAHYLALAERVRLE